MNYQTQPGYIAISSILVIMAVVLIIGTTTALLSVNNIQSSLADKKGAETLDLVEGCAESALLFLSKNNTVPSTIAIHEGSCSVTINSRVGRIWNLTITGTFENYTRSIQIIATRGVTLEIISWIEI